MNIPLKRRSILLIDDDQHALTITSIVLSTMANCEVLGCVSSPDALALAANTTPDLILLSTQMADCDSVDTLAALRKLPNIGAVPVILIIGARDNGVDDNYRPYGVIGAIARSLEPLSLPEHVLQIWDEGTA